MIVGPINSHVATCSQISILLGTMLVKHKIIRVEKIYILIQHYRIAHNISDMLNFDIRALNYWHCRMKKNQAHRSIFRNDYSFIHSYKIVHVFTLALSIVTVAIITILNLAKLAQIWITDIDDMNSVKTAPTT